MKIKNLKKDRNKSVRINSDVLSMIENQGLTLQSYLDAKLDNDFSVCVQDLKLVTNDCKHTNAEDEIERALARVAE
jgi:hypothetical protein